MKKHLLMIAIAIFSSAFLTSCNKGLKDDMKELEQKLAEQEAQNAKYRLALGNNTCAYATLKTGSDFGERTFGGNYCLTRGELYSYLYVDKMTDTTYYVYIQKVSDMDGDSEVTVAFEYDSKNKQVMIIDEVYFSGESINPSLSTNINFAGGGNVEPGCTIDITVNHFDFSTGAISLTCKAVTDLTFSENIYNGYPMTLDVTYSGMFAPYDPALD